MSRGRNDNRLYVVGGIDPDREDVGGEVAGIEDPLKELIAAVGRSRAKDLALDSYEHEEIRNMTMPELRREWEMTRKMVDRMPHNSSGQSAQLEAERRRLEDMLARQRDRTEALKEEVRDIGRLDRIRNRRMVSDLQKRINDASEGASSLDAGLENLGRRQIEVNRAQAQRDEWLLEHAPKVRRLDALGRELWWREQQQAIAAEVAMPQYLANAVGAPPMKPSERSAWHEAVKAVESYRERWGVGDVVRALGEEGPAEEQQNAEREIVEQRLENLTEVSYEVEVDVRERSIGI
jgi:hypothetical protein